MNEWPTYDRKEKPGARAIESIIPLGATIRIFTEAGANGAEFHF